MKSPTMRLAGLVCVVLLAACGTVATPQVTPRPQATEAVVLEPTEMEAEATVAADELTEEATEAVATEAATEEATEIVVTEAATEEATEAAPATEVATEEATVEATAEAAAEGEVAGDPAAGQQLFVTGNTSAGAPSCSTCHLVDAETQLVGPGLLNVGERAANRVAGETAVEYLHQSIVEPNAYVVEGFVPGLMPDVYETAFTEEQINDIIAYLLTLEG